MREDYEMTLNEMFPKGYLIIAILPDNTPQLVWYNPYQDEVLNGIQDLIEENLDETDIDNYNN